MLHFPCKLFIRGLHTWGREDTMALKDNLFYFIKRYFSISLNKGLREGKVPRKEIEHREHGCRFLNSLLHVIYIK